MSRYPVDIRNCVRMYMYVRTSVCIRPHPTTRLRHGSDNITASTALAVLFFAFFPFLRGGGLPCTLYLQSIQSKTLNCNHYL